MKAQDRKILWGKSGNTCAYPECGMELAPDERGSKVIGEEAHIKGEKPGTPRYDPQQSDEEREGYENRILLCPNHHTEVDAYEDKWPVSQLLKIKVAHEEQVRRNRQFPEIVDQLKKLVQQYDGPVDLPDYSVEAFTFSHDTVKIIRVDAGLEQGVNTQIRIRAGQKLRFIARGLISFDQVNNSTTPEGVICNEYGFPLTATDADGQTGMAIWPHEKAYPTDGNMQGRVGSLYGWIGIRSPETSFFIGTKREIDVTQDGLLYLAVNDAQGAFGDNNGEFRVEVEISE